MNGVRRWPPAPRAHPAPAELEVEPEWKQAAGDLSRALARLAPAVLSEATYTLDANGQAADSNYRVPYQSLAIVNLSAAQLTLASSPLQGSAPGKGRGVAIVPAMSFRLVCLTGRAWSVYGGAQGDLITVEAFARPLPPAACALGAQAGASLYAAGTSLNPGAAAVVASLALPAGTWQVTVAVLLGGTVTAPDGSNMALFLSGVQIGTGPLIYPGTTTQNQAPTTLTVTVPAGGATFTVQTIGATGGAANYKAQIVATPQPAR